MIFNRDPMIHSHQNMLQCGLPHELKQQIAAELWGGEDALDQAKNYTPVNDHKVNFCWWSIVTDVLHDSLTLCNWVWPMAQSPSKDRNYRGDLDLEAKFFKAVTGKDVTTDDLYKAAAKIDHAAAREHRPRHEGQERQHGLQRLPQHPRCHD